MSMSIPYAHVWAILNIDFSGATPPWVVPGPYEDTPAGRARNLDGLKKNDNAFFGLVQPLAEEYAERAGLKLDWSDPPGTISRQAVAIVSQTPKEFDVPGIPWPPEFHYGGPFFDDEARQPTPFPWEKLDGRPLVYSSLGTLVNGMESIYQAIFGAVGLMPEIQVVLAKGSNIELADLGVIRPTSSSSTKRLRWSFSSIPRCALRTPDSIRRLRRSYRACPWWPFPFAMTSPASQPASLVTESASFCKWITSLSIASTSQFKKLCAPRLISRRRGTSAK